MSDDRDLKVRRFLRDTYGRKLYALMVGEHTITNIPKERLPMLLASILIVHAGGSDGAFVAVCDARDRLAEIEGRHER